MAIVEQVSKPEYSITLSKDEAKWLMAYIQNDMTEQEDEQSNKRRYGLWSALSEAGVNVDG